MSPISLDLFSSLLCYHLTRLCLHLNLSLHLRVSLSFSYYITSLYITLLYVYVLYAITTTTFTSQCRPAFHSVSMGRQTQFVSLWSVFARFLLSSLKSSYYPLKATFLLCLNSSSLDQTFHLSPSIEQCLKFKAKQQSKQKMPYI